MKRLKLHRKTSIVFAAATLLAVIFPTATTQADSWTEPTVERRIDELMAKMTLAEKVGQLNQYSSSFDLTGPPPSGDNEQRRYEQIRSGGVGSMLNVTGADTTRKVQQLAVENSRLGIPLLFAYDVIHGYQTMFPVPLGETASWDLEAIELSARLAATEAAAAGLHWTFAPMVDVSRDARWGRIMEGAGEDPYLGGVVAAARVRGFQGSDPTAIDTIAACAKHYAGYGLAEAGRDYNTVDYSEQTLRNVILPPFKAAVDAGVATLMNAFNEVGGTPATASRHLQRDILKGEWGFDGFVVSDWGSIGELVEHGFAVDEREAARLAMNAGSDMDMESEAYIGHLAELVESGEIEPRWIDDAVRRVLRLKFQLGLFDDPYRYSDSAREAAWIGSDAIHAAARDVARKSIVLLRNEEDLLPLSKSIGTLAVIGPLAGDKDTPLGSWRAQAVADSAVSLLEGIEAAVAEEVEILYAEGASLAIGGRGFATELEFNIDDRSGFGAAVEAARRADVVVFAFGEDAFQSGEGRSQVDIGLKGLQEELLREILAVNTNVVGVLMSGRPLALPATVEAVPALLEAWHLGSQTGHAIADVLFGDYNPSGKLPVSFPRHVGQEPLYYNAKATGRGGSKTNVFWSHYTDAPNTARFPFGFGLSYTTFRYGKLRLNAEAIDRAGEVAVTVPLTNIGKRAGAEIVQLYIRDLVASATRPVRELKGFQKIELEPGQVHDVTFTLDAEDLSFYNGEKVWRAEPGEFEVFVGTSSAEGQSARFTLR